MARATSSASTEPVERYETSDGRWIYRLRLEVFPEFFGNAYLVCGGERPILVDCGSGHELSNRDLERGLAAIHERFGETLRFEELGAVVVTHGHIDHFGGLSFLRRSSAAPVGIHVLDRRVLSNYEARLTVASKHVELFLEKAGVVGQRRGQYMQMYVAMKGLFSSQPVDFSFEEGAILDGAFEAYHVPGHCPGQVCLRVGDVLLTADHVLPRITPHLSPEVITQSTGVGHYLASLGVVERLEGIRLGLGGHQGPMPDLTARVGEIRASHARRHERLLELAREPRSIVALSKQLFGPVTSYHVLLAILETGAHVEYLYQRGELLAANVEEIERERNPVILYAAL